jgi:hypothetical protein
MRETKPIEARQKALDPKEWERIRLMDKVEKLESKVKALESKMKDLENRRERKSLAVVGMLCLRNRRELPVNVTSGGPALERATLQRLPRSGPKQIRTLPRRRRPFRCRRSPMGPGAFNLISRCYCRHLTAAAPSSGR